MTTTKARLHYRGSIFWLIFWIIVFFPVAIALLVTRAAIEWKGKTYFIDYEGSMFWFFFWSIFFFPVAIVLLIVNGLSFNVEE